jgi:transcriptional regulator with XRE-family HTH domain
VEDRQTPEQQAGARIKDRRVELRLSQEAVAAEMRRLGHPWHQTTVVKTEAAGRPLRVNEVMDLAAVLGVSVWELMGPPQYPSPALRQFFRAEEDVARLQREKADLQRRLEEVDAEIARHTELKEEAAANLVVTTTVTGTAVVATDSAGLTDAAHISKDTNGEH